MAVKDVNFYVQNPEELLKKKPFTRGAEYVNFEYDTETQITQKTTVKLPTMKGKEISQEIYLQEYDPSKHSINSNGSIPEFKVKINGVEQTEKNIVVASARQKNIHTKQVLHLCGNDLELTMLGIKDPKKQLSLLQKLYSSDKQNRILETKELEQKANFLNFKEEWVHRNLKQYRDKAVSTQKSTGDCGTLFSFDTKTKKFKIKNISFADGYVIIPNYDDFGDMIACSLYYKVDEIEYIKMYDNTYCYTFTKNTQSKETSEKGFSLFGKVAHGFKTIPLIYKRGYVAWEFAQSAIEMREVIMAINAVVIKRHGWHWLFLNGSLPDLEVTTNGGVTFLASKNEDAQRADLKTVEYPEATGVDKLLELLDDEIQTASSTTIILPKYIKTGNDVSGTAVKVTMSMDYELALQTANDWQEWTDKFVNLVCQGLGLEEGDISKYTDLRIKGSFKVWMPESEYQYNQMILQLVQSKVLSGQTGRERCTLANPDESERVLMERQQERNEELEFEAKKAEINKIETQTTVTE